MRVTARLIVALQLLSGGVGLAQTEQPQLQSRVARAVARDLRIDVGDEAARLRIQVLASALQLPAQARIHVAAVHAVPGGNEWFLRMECGSRIECLPFEVALLARSAGELPASLSTQVPHAPGDGLAAPTVRAGQRVQLAEEVSGMRLSALGICLQAGGIGQKIRVRNLASGRVVLGRVRAAGRVAVED
jgi:Chaperone for flagella basal body P-ring formation